MLKLDEVKVIEAIDTLAERVKNSNSSNDAMKNSQAALNFANVLVTLMYARQTDCKEGS